MRQQPKLIGSKRIPSYSGFIPELRRWVDRESARFDVYPSFVIATCVSIVSGIKHQPDYHKLTPRARRKNAKR